MAGRMRDGVVGEPRAMAAAGAAAKVELAAAEEAAAAPKVPALVATAAVADLVVAVEDAIGETTSGRSVPRRRATSSPSVLGARFGWPRGKHMLIEHGDAGDVAADVRRGSRRGSSVICGEGTRQVQCDGRGKNRGWRARQADRAIYS